MTSSLSLSIYSPLTRSYSLCYFLCWSYFSCFVWCVRNKCSFRSSKVDPLCPTQWFEKCEYQGNWLQICALMVPGISYGYSFRLYSQNMWAVFITCSHSINKFYMGLVELFILSANHNYNTLLQMYVIAVHNALSPQNVSVDKRPVRYQHTKS
jgi:hypothetical protein